MFEIIQSGGWMMVPILISSVLALAITFERFWTLRASKIAPQNLLTQVWGWMKNKQLDAAKIRSLRESSPLGNVLAAGLINSRHGRVGKISMTPDGVVHTAREGWKPKWKSD
jgi:biopolymer transport protein ExbB